MPRPQRRALDSIFGEKTVDTVKTLMARKWDSPNADEPDSFAPWVELDEVVAATSLTPFEARRVLDHLARTATPPILFEPPDTVSQLPARWVLLLDRHDELGLPASSRCQSDKPSLLHITSEYG